MKFIGLHCSVWVCAFLLSGVSAWGIPKNLQKAASIAFTVSAISTAPLVANAIDFSGSYADPNHPNCKRIIVQDNTNIVKISGTDGNPGCPADGSGEAWTLTGLLQGDSILVDFTPKGGPKDLMGVFDDTFPPGIKWPDGNKWSMVGRVVDSLDLNTDNIM